MTSSARGITLAELGLEVSIQGPSGVQSSAQEPGSPNQLTAGSAQKLYNILQGLVITLSTAHPLDELLRSLATLSRQVTSMDLSIVMLLDDVNGQMTMQASSPDLRGRGVNIVPLNIEQHLWAKLCNLNGPSQLPVLDVHEKEQLNPLKNVEYETLLIVPLLAHGDCIGLINCYSSKCIDLAPEDQLLLNSIAMQSSLAIQNRLLVDAPAQGNSVTLFFDDLLSAEPVNEEALQGRAISLGCDLTTPHAMVMLAMSLEHGEPAAAENQLAAFKRTVKLTKQRIEANYPGSLLDERGNILYCILPLDNDITGGALKSWLDGLVRQVGREQHLHLFTGISNFCHNIGDFRRGFAEAGEALQIGQYLSQDAGSAHFNDLSVYRYLYTFARSNSLRDLYLEQMAAIARYDQGHKRSELLDTLELYLECGGNIKDTSERLGVHRNTLTQRIERIQSLCTINIDQYSNRLALQVAIKIHKLRALAL